MQSESSELDFFCKRISRNTLPQKSGRGKRMRYHNGL